MLRVNNTEAVNFLVLQNKRQGFRSLMPKGLTLFSPQAYFYEFLPSQVITKVPSDFFFLLFVCGFLISTTKRDTLNTCFF